jgi:hypothetical protein
LFFSFQLFVIIYYFYYHRYYSGQPPHELKFFEYEENHVVKLNLIAIATSGMPAL